MGRYIIRADTLLGTHTYLVTLIHDEFVFMLDRDKAKRYDNYLDAVRDRDALTTLFSSHDDTSRPTFLALDDTPDPVFISPPYDGPSVSPSHNPFSGCRSGRCFRPTLGSTLPSYDLSPPLHPDDQPTEQRTGEDVI